MPSYHVVVSHQPTDTPAAPAQATPTSPDPAPTVTTEALATPTGGES